MERNGQTEEYAIVYQSPYVMEENQYKIDLFQTSIIQQLIDKIVDIDPEAV